MRNDARAPVCCRRRVRTNSISVRALRLCVVEREYCLRSLLSDVVFVGCVGNWFFVVCFISGEINSCVRANGLCYRVGLMVIF